MRYFSDWKFVVAKKVCRCIARVLFNFNYVVKDCDLQLETNVWVDSKVKPWNGWTEPTNSNLLPPKTARMLILPWKK